MFDLKDLMSRVNLPQDITRRGFLQVATVTAAFAAMNQSRAQTSEVRVKPCESSNCDFFPILLPNLSFPKNG